MKYWLARLSFSFFIIAAVLAWDTYRAVSRGTMTPTRAILPVIAIVLAISLGIAGIRERHRHL